MNKRLVLIFIAIFLSASFGLISKSAAGRHETMLVGPTVAPADDLYLDRREVVIPGEPGYRCQEKCDGNMIINVIARGINVEERKNSYRYTISGGRILDEGKNVRWDLTGVKPGTYTITVAVGDGEKTKESTATITVRDCNCSGDCSCPTLAVTAERSVKAGETITFTAQVSGGTATDINYNWTISQGEIIDGQGTPAITVQTTGKMTGNIKATVEISGELCADCQRTGSAIANINK